jgi:hypothetical protein
MRAPAPFSHRSHDALAIATGFDPSDASINNKTD